MTMSVSCEMPSTGILMNRKDLKGSSHKPKRNTIPGFSLIALRRTKDSIGHLVSSSEFEPSTSQIRFWSIGARTARSVVTDFGL
jgi:hypothetical protein